MRTPTSATHIEPGGPPLPGDLRSRRASCGFTLIELIVALAVVGLLLAAVPVAIERAADSLAYRSAVQGIAASMRAARNRAMTDGAPAAFFVAVSRRQYGVEGGESERFSDRLAVTATAAVAVRRDEGVQRIVFMPDGSSSGGSVLIVRSSGQGVRLRVDWLLGRITHEPPAS